MFTEKLPVCEESLEESDFETLMDIDDEVAAGDDTETDSDLDDEDNFQDVDDDDYFVEEENADAQGLDDTITSKYVIRYTAGHVHRIL